MTTESHVIKIAESALQSMRFAARRSAPIETGGVLAGVLAGEDLWITHALELPTTDRSRNHYRLPGRRTRSTIRSLRTVDPRLGYLGDWHSHPHDVGPSPMDLATLALISVIRRGEPVPAIIVLREAVRPVAFRIHRGVLREHELVLTGDLPEPPFEKDEVQ